MLVHEAVECPDQRHVADDIDRLAIDGRGLVGKIVMQRAPRCGEIKHHGDHEARQRGERRCHRPADRHYKRDRRHGRGTRRQHVPDQHVFHREHGGGGCADPARERAGHMFGKVARRVPRQIAKQVAPEVAGNPDKRHVTDPSGDAPEQAVCRDQRDNNQEWGPDPVRADFATCQSIDQEFNPVLSAD